MGKRGGGGAANFLNVIVLLLTLFLSKATRKERSFSTEKVKSLFENGLWRWRPRPTCRGITFSIFFPPRKNFVVGRCMYSM